MIRINLLPGPKKRAGGGAGLNLDALKAMVTQVKDPLLLGVAASWAVGGLLLGGLWFAERTSLSSLQEQEEQVTAEARRFQRLIAEKRRAENLRDSLLAELQAIREIDADRYVWPHILEEVTKALPDYTWLVSLDQLTQSAAALDATDSLKPPVRLEIEGRTSDISAYTRFVRQLANSPWLTSVDFGPAQTVIEEERPITAFTVTVTFRQADSAFIRTVPVLESVR